MTKAGHRHQLHLARSFDAPFEFKLRSSNSALAVDGAGRLDIGSVNASPKGLLHPAQPLQPVMLQVQWNMCMRCRSILYVQLPP